MFAGMNNTSPISLSLVGLLFADCLLVSCRRAPKPQTSSLVSDAPQLWLQDLVLASLAYGFCLMLTLKRLERPVWLVSEFYVFPAVGSGLLAALALCRREATLQTNGLARAGVSSFLMMAFGVSPELCLVFWWLERRVNAYLRRRSTAGLTAFARWAVVVILLVYGIAFLLPLEGSERGHYAYRICFEKSVNLTFRYGTDSGSAIALALPWSANPALWVGLSFLITGRWFAASVSALLALFFGLSIKLYCLSEGSYGLFEDAASSPAYYTWLGSMALLLVAGLLGDRLARCAKAKTATADQEAAAQRDAAAQ
ncbi:MAG: hypothetical protein NTW87_10095 [Planctomycetota bacterium]|nr:hypothetical protein [Planctomycetota bacterium]